jgi:hypothetical protein
MRWATPAGQRHISPKKKFPRRRVTLRKINTSETTTQDQRVAIASFALLRRRYMRQRGGQQAVERMLDVRARSECAVHGEQQKIYCPQDELNRHHGSIRPAKLSVNRREATPA